MPRTLILITFILFMPWVHAAEIISAKEKLNFVSTVVENVLQVTESTFILQNDSLTLHASNTPPAILSGLIDIAGLFVLNDNTLDVEYVSFALWNPQLNLMQEGYLYIYSLRGLWDDGDGESFAMLTNAERGCRAQRLIAHPNWNVTLYVASKPLVAISTNTTCSRDATKVLNLDF